MLTLSADMDESSSLLDLLECSVCLERLDTTAKVLPCQHTFCRRCLENIVSSRNELRCPECRILVDCGVDDLPANILLVRLLDGIKQRPQRVNGGGGGAGGRQPLTVGSLQGYAAGISASPPGTATRELPVAVRSSPVKVSYCPTILSLREEEVQYKYLHIGLISNTKFCLWSGRFLNSANNITSVPPKGILCVSGYKHSVWHAAFRYKQSLWTYSLHTEALRLIPANCQRDGD